MGLSRDRGVSWFVFESMFSLWLFFFCAWRFNFVTENYPSYHPYCKLLIISPGLCNFVRGVKRAYKPGKVTYICACTKKVLQTQAALVLSKILFEFTRFFKLQNVVKIDAISMQTRRGLISGGLIPGCICLFTANPWPPLPPPRLVYRDRPITGEADKNVSVCVLGVGALTSESLWYLKRLSTVEFKEQRTET